jgi:uncharacterized protein
MRKSILLFVVILTTLTSYIAKAETTTTAYTIETVPNVYVKDLRQHVSDPDGLLSIAARDSINRMFTTLEQKTGIQAMVVMLPSIGDDNIFDFSQDLFRYWGIGDKEKNNGLLITYVADQRTIRFHTGYGLEGYLTDALGKRIQTTYMIPAFKQGDTDTGMVKGMRAVYKVLEDSMDPNKKKEEEESHWTGLIMLAIIIAVASYFIGRNDKKARTCKACKKPGALNRMSTDYYYDSQRMKHRKDVFICSNCGHVEVRDKIVDDGNHHNNDLLKGIIIGSILSNMRGGGGGGGFTGGSFGGGSTGGGGSSSSW